jgi:hypothetical protein
MVLPNNVYHSENQVDRKESERRWKWREQLGQQAEYLLSTTEAPQLVH